mgnify:CR=1 FL=1
MKFFQSSNSVENEVADHLKIKFGRQVELYSSSGVGGGCISHASKIRTSEGDFFLKWNSGCPADMFEREAEGLEELKKAAADKLIIPRVYAVKKVDATPGFIVLEFLGPGNFTQNADEMLGRGLAAVHRFSGERFGFYNNNYCGETLQDNSWKSNWPVFFRDNRLGFLLKLIQKQRTFPVEEELIYNRLLEKIPELIPADSKPALIHGDLWSGNYMISANGPALIDPASCYTDREMELGIVTMFGGFSQQFYDAYQEAYPLPSDWRERNRLYQLYHILNHYYLFGGSYRSQALQIAKSYI